MKIKTNIRAGSGGASGAGSNSTSTSTTTVDASNKPVKVNGGRCAGY